MGRRQTCTPYNPLPLADFSGCTCHVIIMVHTSLPSSCTSIRSHSACTALGCHCHVLDNADIPSLPTITTHWCVVDATNVVPLWCHQRPSLVRSEFVTSAENVRDSGQSSTNTSNTQQHSQQLSSRVAGIIHFNS